MGRDVALKIDTRTLDEERDRRRFLREAESAGRMSGHPNIVHVYDGGVTSDNHPYLVMELCVGGSYAGRIKKDGPIGAGEARELGIKIADALDAAHRSGILHRDVKPGNILVNRYGVPGLSDFGLAAVFDASRDTSVTVEALTPAYAAPEVFRLERPSEAADIYSLAATLYTLMSGRPPRWPETGSPSPVQMVTLHNEPIPDIVGIPRDLLDVLRIAMAPDPSQRYQTAAQLRDALIQLRLDGAVTTVGAPPGAPTSGAVAHSGGGYWPPAGSPVYPTSGSAGRFPSHSGGQAQWGEPSDGRQSVSLSGSSVSGNNWNVDAPRRSRALVVVLAILSVLFVATSITAGAIATGWGDSGSGKASPTQHPSATNLPGANNPCLLQTDLASCPTQPECFGKIAVDGRATRAPTKSTAVSRIGGKPSWRARSRRGPPMWRIRASSHSRTWRRCVACGLSR